jgi:uroporphyrinogen decarboxylase
MTRRERVIATIRHQQSDMIPYQIDFTQVELDKVVRETGKTDYAQMIGNHIVMMGFFDGWKEVKPDFWQDDFGVVWNRTVDKDIGVVETIQLPEPDLSGLKLPTVNPAHIHEICQRLENWEIDAFKVAGIGFSMFERAWTLRGMENLLADMIENPEFVHGLLDAICELNLAVIRLTTEHHFDGFYFGDDWGSQSGMIMGPKLWRTFIKPRVARMYAEVKKSGKAVLQHSCGDIEAVFPDLIDIGLDVYQTFQPEIYDIAKVKREVGSHLSFWGGISTQQLLAGGSVAQVRDETVRIMRIMGQNGGYIASPTHAVPGDVPTANIEMLVEIFHNQEKYLN